MKKSFHVFFLFVLFLLFAVNAAWAYNVTVANVDGGSVYSDKVEAMQGETVTLEINPDEINGSIAYKLVSLKVTYGENGSVTVTRTDNTATFTMPASNVTVTPSWAKIYTVSIMGATGGSIESETTPSGWAPTATAGETVELTITTNDHYSFTGIEVKDSDDKTVAVTLSGGKATFTMPESDVTVTGSWVRVYDVEISNVTGGTVTTDKEAASAGEKVTLTITRTPSSRYVLAGLEVKTSNGALVDVEISSDKSSATFTMPSFKVSVTPTWVEEYVVSIQGVTGGTVETNKSTASVGETVTLTISPDVENDYELESINVYKGNGFVDVNVSDGKATFTMPDRDVTVYPYWRQAVRFVTIESVTGGTVAQGKGDYKYGETVTLTISPDVANGYELASLKVTYGTNGSVNASISDDKTKATFPMPAFDVTVTPSWAKTEYSVTITKVAGGTVTTDKEKAVKGDAVTLTISSDETNDYELTNLEVTYGDNSSVTVTRTDNTATFWMPAANVTVTPSWAKVEHSVTITNVTGGTVTTDKEKTTYGETVTLTIAPTTGYQFNSLTVKDAAENAVDVTLSNNKTSATFSMPKSDVTVTPSWNAVLVDDGDGVLYVNMLETGTKELSIPENVKSFKVYDDGGKDENHSLNADGYLVLNAPEGYQLQVTGTARYRYAYFFIYDGDSEAKKLFDGGNYADNGIDVGTIRSSGNKLTVYFKSRSINVGSNYSGLDLTVSLVKVDFGAVSIAKADDGKIHATINGDYAGKDALVISEAIEVDAVDYNRELEVDVPVTALLPVTLPAGTTVNAEFYTLEKVEQVEGMKWQATMKYIGDGNLPQPNTPYAVILPKGQSELKFDLPSGKKATVQTGDINKVCGVDASCKLDENGKITDDWFFTGTYAYKEWKEDDEELGLAYAFSANDNPGGAAKGKFGKIKINENSSEYPRAKAMRCYLRKRDANVKLQQQNQAQMVAASPYVAKFSINNLPETIDVEFVKDDAKGGRTVLHGRMNTVTGEFKMLRDYDLKGRKVNSTNRARGAYYGKKVMKK